MRALILFLSIFLLAACNLLRSGDSNYNPEIVFSADDKKGTPQVYTMNGDGSNVTKLTNWDVGATEPSWSPDGKTILFSSFRKGTSIGPGMWVMKADGSNKRPLYEYQLGEHRSALEGNNARWSPDGKHVVFDLCASCQISTNYEIYIFDPQTKEVTKLTEHLASDTNPTWSPDGTKIAFVSDRDYPEDGGSDIYILEIEEGTITRVTQTGNAGRQLWTPNGQELIYWSENNLHIIELSTLESEVISFGIEGNTGFRPFSLSPDGNKVLLHVFSYTSTVKEQSLQQLDLSNGALTPIYSGKGINGVDWISQQNK